MKKIQITKKAAAQAAVAGGAAAIIILLGVSQRTSIGQTYQRVSVNGNAIGCVSERVDMDDVIKEARRELSNETGERISCEIDWSAESSRELFSGLLSEDELKEAVKGILREEGAQGKTRVYTVAIEEYRANFTSLTDVETFLNKVKAPLDGENAYETIIYASDSHISGILNAELAKSGTESEITQDEAAGEDDAAKEAAGDISVNGGIAGVSAEFSGAGEKAAVSADGVLAGATAELSDAMAYAFANPKDNGYENGILGMEFIESVEVFENYVDADRISDIDTQVAEVTKEKESNKIYVVEPGDCLSVIAMDHDTTVSSIVALNGFENSDVMIRDGQELIIAVPEPDLKIRLTVGEVYEEDYTADPVIMENDSWYTTKEVVHQEGTTGHRERNDVVVYENGVETNRTLLHENIMVESQAAVIERGTIIPPTYIKPISGGRYTSGFGRRWGRMHKGVDWACPVGTTVYASCGGTVIQASYNGGYGNNVVIQHPDGRMTRYAHNSKLLVHVGQHVEQGEPIALSGNTGRSTGPHVHFEIYINGSAVDPLKYISY